MNKVNDSVLVVEDDAALREALVDTLQAAGLAALPAHDAQCALELLTNQDIGLVISDVHMPGANGYETAVIDQTAASLSARGADDGLRYGGAGGRGHA